ncbi:hypothetical protein [Shewanella surugensis]|uniref:Uncharacterized protein n=1 Tax=Shewanella surugensis TaxID=212020 RepID=A0ABT0LEF4_9GAMM|nr:hypothetical protein [Shewanella surugensis]MCL1126082.1 hypothetical protein [Shewanella surugensis]
MFRGSFLLVFVLSGLLCFLSVLTLFSSVLGVEFGILQKQKANGLVDYLFIIIGGCVVSFYIASRLIFCEHCQKQLISFREGGQATRWNNLLWAWLTKRRVLCPRCKRPNNLRKIN